VVLFVFFFSCNFVVRSLPTLLARRTNPAGQILLIKNVDTKKILTNSVFSGVMSASAMRWQVRRPGVSSLTKRPALPGKMISQLQINNGNSNSSSPATIRPKKPCVLLVEDDRSLRRYLEVVLRQEGYEVFAAADGLEAMRISLRSAIDVVVTDAIMPHLNGYELCRFLRNTPHLSHLRIVLLSALDNIDSQPRDLQADEFLAKPVRPEDLIACVERLLLVPA
jgi:CheY-like chemotaxis protein